MIDFNSPTWLAFCEQTKETISILRDDLENELLSETEAAILRGQIQAYREVLSLGNVEKPIEVGSTTYID